MILISICGPTSSGKSSSAISLAQSLDQKFGSDSSVIISADSRQVYSYLDLGTGKIAGKWGSHHILGRTFFAQNIPHFLIDFKDPNLQYDLNSYLQDYVNLFKSWNNLGFLPKFVILCGGTGLYLKAVLEEFQLTLVDKEFENLVESFRNDLLNLNAPELQQYLKTHFPDYKAYINDSDWQNPRRLINHILRAETIKKNWSSAKKLEYPKFEQIYQFYLNPPDLLKMLEVRLNQRFEEGLIQESLDLIQKNIIPTNRLKDLGLEYRQFYYYYFGLQSLQEYKKGVLQENKQYIKRQLTWFAKQKNLIQINNFQAILAFFR